MSQLKPKFITGALLLLIVWGFANSRGYSQFIGLSVYFSEDSTSSYGGANMCLSETLDGTIFWSHAGSYLPGDNVDFNVDWGDGNTSPYSNVPVISGPGYGYIDPPISLSHNYAAVGVYTVIITAVDNYSNADADTFQFNVSNLCGSVVIQTRLDNGNGFLDAGDMYLPNVPVTLTSGISYGTTTNSWGSNYIVNIDITQPPYSLEVDPAWLAANGHTVIDPVAGSYTVTGLGTPTQFYYFLMDCPPSSYYDGSIHGYGTGFRPGLSDGNVALFLNNNSCSGTPVTNDISLDFDPMLTVYSSTMPGGIITPGNISWTGASIPFGLSTIIVYFTVPPGTPAFTPLAFQAEITSTSATDLYPANNIHNFNSEVRNSWDPNDKSTDIPHAIDVNTQEEIVYTIRFQNMGNADALEIHIADTISNLLDLSTFRLISQSHDGSYSLDPVTREVIFTFPNINLVPESVDPILSQGYVMYSIKENPGLSLNSDIQNTAHIFFDTNPAVVTNTTSNVNVMNPAGVENPSELSTLVVYPTPADHFVHLDGIDLNEISGVTVYDLNGKTIELMKNIYNGMVPVSQIPNGVYLLEVESGGCTVVRKICIQH